MKRNIAANVSRGAAVTAWDDDDIYAPDRVERQASVHLARFPCLYVVHACPLRT